MLSHANKTMKLNITCEKIIDNHIQIYCRSEELMRKLDLHSLLLLNAHVLFHICKRYFAFEHMNQMHIYARFQFQ